MGQTVGNYQIIAKLGEGGMGNVFLAEHPVIGSKVAVKAIHPQFARDADVISRFVTEARAVNQIGHDHIVNINDFGHTPAGDFYFVMEYLPGQMLSDRIAAGALPCEQAIGIAAQIADALDASHERGVIHRDLKPGNVLLITRENAADFVKVFDFGLAKLTHGAAAHPSHITRAGTIMGTPHYMSPEQCDGTRELDSRSDIYALGVMVFEMLTGRVPFGGEAYGEVMLKHLSAEPPALRSLVPDLSPALEAVVLRAMSKNPDHRFQSMREFRDGLLSATAPKPEPIVTPVQPAPNSTMPAAIDFGSLRRRPRYGRLVALGAAALAAVAIGASSGLHLRMTHAVAAEPAAKRSDTAAPATPAEAPRPDARANGTAIDAPASADNKAELQAAPRARAAAGRPSGQDRMISTSRPASSAHHPRHDLAPANVTGESDDVLPPSTW